jgi:hypothetical protein
MLFPVPSETGWFADDTPTRNSVTDRIAGQYDLRYRWSTLHWPSTPNRRRPSRLLQCSCDAQQPCLLLTRSAVLCIRSLQMLAAARRGGAMSLNDVIQRLKEDRQILERELRQTRIRAAFESARTQPVDTPPTQVGPEIVCELIVEAPVAAPRPSLRPLVDRAAPLLERLASTPLLRPRPDKDTWTIDEIPTETPERLFDEALTSLGYPPITDVNCTPVTQEIAPKKKWWQK